MDYWHTMLAKISSLYGLSAPVALRNEAFNGSSSTSVLSLWGDWFKPKTSFQDTNQARQTCFMSIKRTGSHVPGQRSTWERCWVILDKTMSESPPLKDDRFENQTDTLICDKVNFDSNSCLCTCFAYSVRASLYILQVPDRESWRVTDKNIKYSLITLDKISHVQKFSSFGLLVRTQKICFLFHFRLSLFSDFWNRFWFSSSKHIYQPFNISNKIYFLKFCKRVFSNNIISN